MYVKEMGVDHWDGVDSHESCLPQPSAADAEKAIRALDSVCRTLVTLVGEAGAHLAIGGGAGRYVVYATYDNRSFHNLVGASKEPSSVCLNVGGQMGEFAARHIVSLEAAIQAALAFLETGQLASHLTWEEQ